MCVGEGGGGEQARVLRRPEKRWAGSLLSTDGWWPRLWSLGAFRKQGDRVEFCLVGGRRGGTEVAVRLSLIKNFQWLCGSAGEPAAL